MSTPERRTTAIVDAGTRFAVDLSRVDDIHDARMTALKTAETRIRERARTIERHPERFCRTGVDELLEQMRALQAAEQLRHQTELNRIHEKYLAEVVRTLDV